MSTQKATLRGKEYYILPTELVDKLLLKVSSIKREKLDMMVRQMVRFSYKQGYYPKKILLTEKFLVFLKHEADSPI